MILGAGLGLCLALVEQVLRRAWVQVQSGRQEGRIYLLAHPKCRLGLDERAEVGIFGDPPSLAATPRSNRRRQATFCTRLPPRRLPASTAGRSRVTNRFMMAIASSLDALTLCFGSVSPHSFIGLRALPMDPSTKSAAREIAWSLEVVRGRQAGRAYKLGPGETVVGNALNGQPGVDLKDQEGDAPRRMAGRHAALVSTGVELVIRDLETPGGTFVNRQRLLAGQARRLEPGDLIQLASVQLAVKRVEAQATASPRPAVAPLPATPVRPAAPPPSAGVSQGTAPPKPSGGARPLAAGRLAIPFSLPGGPNCRSWDDFLVLAAQNWHALRDELTSGRLGDFIRRAQRPDLLPRLEKARSADDQLDDWLGRLPTTKPSAPELDVHPESLLVRAVAGGGLTRQTLRVTNIGYRLLRSTARVEPVGVRWLRLPAAANGGPFATIDQTDLAVELDLPETLDKPLEASILIESNGGTRRVPVRIERAEVPADLPDAAVTEGFPLALGQVQLGEKLAEVRPGARVLFGAAGAILLRLLVVLVGLVLYGARGARPLEARLSSVALALVGSGAVAAGLLARRRGERRDVSAAAFAGGSLGLLAAAICFAIIQSVEHVLGIWSTSVWAVGFLWGTIGALVALASNYLIPHRPATREVAP